MGSLIALLPELGLLGWLTAAGTGVGSIFGALKGYVWLRELSKGKYKILRITKSNDKNLNAFCLLYYKLIDEIHRIDFSYMEMWLKSGGFGGTKQQIRLCYHKGSILGFCQFFYSIEKEIAFISYLGVDSENASVTSGVSDLLLKSVGKFLSRKVGKNFVVLFEVESPKEKNIDSKERARRTARIRHFSALGSDKSRSIYQVDLNYVQPETPNEHTKTNQHCMQLLTSIRSDHIKNKKVRVEEVIDWISFIYYDIYLHSYANDAEMSEIYKDSLDDLIKEARQNAERWVALS